MELSPDYQGIEPGTLPADWRVTELGTCAFVTKLAGFEYTHHFDYRKSGPIVAVRALNIKNGTLDLSDTHTLPKETSELLPRSQLAKGDLVISYVGTLGRVAVIPENNRFHLAPNVAKIRVDTAQVDPFYLNQYLNGEPGHRAILKQAASTTQAALSMQNLRRVPVTLPPLPEQRAIAAALSDVDALISGLDQLLAKKRNIKQGAMQQLLTGKTRLPGFSGEWEVRKLGSVFAVTAGGDFDESRSSAIRDEVYCYPIYSNAIANNGLHGYCSYNDHPAGTITVTARGTLGVANFRDHNYTAIGRVLVLDPNTVVDGRFFSQFINHELDFAIESTGVPQLTAPQVSKYELSVPSFPEQRAIASVLSDMDAETAALEQRRDKTRALKQGMMQELLTGRIRLI